MVIIDPAMIPSTELAPSAPPVNDQPHVCNNQFVTGPSKAMLAKARNTAVIAITAGMNHKLERIRSQYLKISVFNAMAPHSLACSPQPNVQLTAPMALPRSGGKPLAVNSTMLSSHIEGGGVVAQYAKITHAATQHPW
jgi:hypothetical protein